MKIVERHKRQKEKRDIGQRQEAGCKMYMQILPIKLANNENFSDTKLE